MEKALEFSLDDYRIRLDKARRLTAEHQIDFLLLRQAENLTYLAGYRAILYQSKFRPFLAIVSIDKESVLILPVLERGVE